MSKYEMDEDSRALPKPIALTPEEVRHVAAGVAAILQAEPEGRGTTAGMYPPPPIEVNV